jgi:hypothetical protein
MPACTTRTLVTVPTELPGMQHVNLLSMLLFLLRLYPHYVLYAKCDIFLLSSGAASLQADVM